MNPKERRFELYLEDMMTSIDRIGQYTVNCDFNSFCNSTLIVDAVVGILRLLGKLPRTFQKKSKENIMKCHGKRCMVCEI